MALQRTVLLICLVLRAAAAAAAPPDPLDAARALHVAQRWAEALAAYREIAASADPEAAAVAHNNACVILNGLGDYPAALEACRAALALRRGQGDERGRARTLNNLGLALQHLGRYDEATLAYREALGINERRGDLEAQLVNRQNLGLVATDAGRYREALERFTAAEALAEEHAGEPWAPRQSRLARLNQGVVLEKLGAHALALDLYRRLAEDQGELEPAHWASLQVNLGVMYRNLGDPVSAVRAFEEAAATYERLGDTAALSNATLNLALAWHLNLGRLGDAERAYREALRLARASGDRAEEIQDLFYLGRLLLDRGWPEEAKRVFGQCLEAAEAAGSAEGRWSALSGLGHASAAGGRPRQALTYFEQAIGEIEQVRAGLDRGPLRSGYFGDKRPVYAAAVGVLAELEAAEPNAGHRQRALEIVQRIKSRELLESLGGERRQTTPLDSGALAERLGRSVGLEYFVGTDELFLWVVSRASVRMESLGPHGPILDRVLEVHRTLATGREPPAATLESLSRALLPGLVAEIAGAPDLKIAPDGALHYLPFEILPAPGPAAPGETRALIEVLEVSYLPSASALAWLGRHRPPAALTFAGFGSPEPVDRGEGISPGGRADPRFELGPLPAAARELRAAADLLGGESWISTGAGATEEALRRAVARGARVVHLATHTVVDERPGQGSAILLTPAAGDDGLLRPEEIAGLDYRADLTVLSACRSAPGAVEEGRAFATLTGAFLTAGSDAVIASLWDVGDEASAAFMEQLYHQLARGRSPADALRRAKLRLRSDPAWNRPDLWAPFVLIGDAGAVVPARRVPPWAWIGAAVLAALALWRLTRVRSGGARGATG